MRTNPAFAVVAAMVFAPAVWAAPKVSVDVYSVPRASIDALVPGRRDADEDGSGAGLRALARSDWPFVLIGDVQTASYGGGIDREQLRLGIGTRRMASSSAAAYVEYVGMDLNGAPSDGLGAHWRYTTSAARRLQFYAEAGVLALQDSSERITGWEATGGTALRLTRWLEVFADYRTTRLRGRTSELELEFADVRVGGRVTFGGQHEP